ncbi:MAG: hypothetical protein K0R66_1506, partial [Gammaproteobacteria bacterium]|nr:hypothetical protein [Gammaproteobacteria bacterium]
MKKELRQSLIALSKDAKYEAMLSLLEPQLKSKEISLQKLLDFAKYEVFPDRQPCTYVMTAELINDLASVIKHLPETELNHLHIEFYKLSADRHSLSGCRNYAIALYKQNQKYDESLLYIERAIGLASPYDKKRLLLWYAHILRINKRFQEANHAMREYYQFLRAELAVPMIDKAAVIKEMKWTTDLFKTVFSEINATLSPAADLNVNLKEMDQFLQVIGSPQQTEKTLADLRLEGIYIKGKIYELQGNSVQAMKAYLEVNDKAHYKYASAVSARARLIKAQIQADLNAPIVSGSEPNIGAAGGAGSAAASTSSPAKSKKPDQSPAYSHITLPNGLVMPLSFAESWKQETWWFDSIKTEQIEDEYKKRQIQLSKLIEAKNIELELILEQSKILAVDHSEKTAKLYQELDELKHNLKSLEKARSSHLPGYRAAFRRHKAEAQFFDPTRSKKRKRVAELASEIVDQRYTISSSKKEPIKLTGSAKDIVSAEVAYQKVVSRLSPERKPGIPIARSNSWPMNRSYGPVEHYMAGSTLIKAEHSADPNPQRLGHSYMPTHGSYDSIYGSVLSKLIHDNADNEKTLASYIIRYGRSHQTVSIEELKALNPEANNIDLERFNQFCFLIISKEQSQWLSASKEVYQLGMAVAQARCLIMLEAGFIKFEDAFKNDALFGVYSQKEILSCPEKVEKACKSIEDLYIEYLKTHRAEQHLAFYKRNMAKPAVELVLTRKQAHADLVYVYGGEDDTDSEGYDTDLAIAGELADAAVEPASKRRRIEAQEAGPLNLAAVFMTADHSTVKPQAQASSG